LRTGLAVPTLFTLVVFGIFISLGTWQLQRKAWKEDLIATLEQRSRAEPVALPPSSNWSALKQADEEFRRVKFKAEFLPAREALMYTGDSEFRPDARRSGYLVFAPARTPDGAVVVVNRGFTPEQREYQAHDTSPGIIDIVGAMRWPERAGWFVREYDDADRIWFARNHLGMAVHTDWGPVAPFYVELESPRPAGGVPRPGLRKVGLRNAHLIYAMTWYALAVVVVVMFGFWLRARARAGAAAPSL
jgi:surfeit locus 1 family protein